MRTCVYLIIYIYHASSWKEEGIGIQNIYLIKLSYTYISIYRKPIGSICTVYMLSLPQNDRAATRACGNTAFGIQI